MAFHSATYECDWCEKTEHYDEEADGLEDGWWLLESGPTGKVSFCSQACLESYLA